MHRVVNRSDRLARYFLILAARRFIISLVMIQIDEAFVVSQAPNAEAIKNGRRPVLKGRLLKPHRGADLEALAKRVAESANAR
jgi:hypothetical protein